MATNAEHQRRWRERQKELVAQAIHEDDTDREIVRKLVDAIGPERARSLVKKMDGLITALAGKPPLPDCPLCEGRGLVDVYFGSTTVKAPCGCIRRKRGEDFHAKLREEEAAEKAREERMKRPFSFGVEATAKDGRVWASGVRLATREEAEDYIDSQARWELKKHGYVTHGDACDLTFDVKRYDEPPVMWITKRGKRSVLNFPHGTCGLFDWRSIAGGQCECKKCQRDRLRREAEERWAEEYRKECEVVERARAANEISQEQYDEWENSTVDDQPEWLVRLRAAARENSLT